MSRRTVPARTAVLVGAMALAVAGCGSAQQEDSGGPVVPAPAGVTADASSATSVHVMWNRAEDDAPVAGYAVYQDGDRVEDLPAHTYMTDVVDLRPGEDYVFTVRAVDADGRLSPESSAVAVTTLPAVTDDDEPPTAPGELTVESEGPRSVTLTWSEATDDTGVTAYDIHQSGVRVHSVSGTETSTLVTGLRPDTAYEFTVIARDAADNASPASPVAETTTETDDSDGADPGSATAPTNLTAEVVDTEPTGAVELTWTPPATGGEVTDYEVHLNGELATTILGGAVSSGGDEVSYTLRVDDETTARHAVRVRARLQDGHWGAFSEEATVTLPATADD